MNLFQRLTFAILVALLASAASAQTYNVVTDFSLASNPNGAWTYGFLFMPGTSFIPYTSSSRTCTPGLSLWGLVISPCYSIPAVGQNTTGTTFCWATDCLPPDYLVTSPGDNDRLNVVRWTAPTAGVYGVSGSVMGTDCVYPTSADFHVSQNNHQSVTVVVDNCDVPASFNLRRTFAAGDRLDFTTDWGCNHNTYGDGTGFKATITPIP